MTIHTEIIELFVAFVYIEFANTKKRYDKFVPFCICNLVRNIFYVSFLMFIM